MSPIDRDRPDIASAHAAVQRAQAERGATSVAWLERAHRLSPDDPTIAFLLASAVLAIDPARALTMLLALLDAWPGFRDAQTVTAAAELRLARPDAAAARLGALLANGTAPSGARFRTLADAICRAAGMPGWIGVDGAGRLEIAAPGSVALAVDGIPVAAMRSGLARRMLPARWRTASWLEAALDGRALLGSPASLVERRRTEGFVDLEQDGSLVGWAWLPGDPDRKAPLTLLLDGIAATIVADDDSLPPSPGHVLDRRRGFRIPAAALGGATDIRVIGPDGRDLTGSPLHPGREAAAARAAAARLARPQDGATTTPDLWRPLDAALLAHLRPPPQARQMAGNATGIDIVIPVWRGADDLAACLSTLGGEIPLGTRILVVDDASSDPALRALLATREARGEISVLRHGENRGFPAAANTGLRHADGRDVVLLNPDTLLPPGAVARLARAAYSAADIGSATPMTNDGTLSSYPPASAIADAESVRRLDVLVRRANGRSVETVPTAVGFCMYLRQDCLRETGLFREDAFAQGYGEENDWSFRARHLGWRHVVATGVFVAHLGGRSFGAVKADLMARNTRVLNRLHPGYDAAIHAFLARDPLAPARRAIDAARWTTGRRRQGAVALVTHGQGGGVARHVAQRAASIRAEGRRPIVLVPAPGGVAVGDGTVETFPDLVFALPGDLAGLVELLTRDGTRRIELHHFIGHRLDIADIARRLGVPFEVTIHDSALWCPRITLTQGDARYCGEPADIAVCEACVRDHGTRLREDIAVAGLRTRSRDWLSAADHIVVPCEDAARRIARQFPGTRPVIAPWEDDRVLVRALIAPASNGGHARIVVAGAIGPEKGFQKLLDCARDAATRHLPLDFAVVGHTIDDARLIETGRVFVTGAFGEGEGPPLVAAQRGQLGFIPSVVPETWCYSLSTLWQGGLRVACFAFGAQAERVARTGAGAVLPLGAPIPDINDFLLMLASGKTASSARHPMARRGS